ncbi:nucleotide disphospho-sugar-binding domain-containing protein [Fontimonas sp. SYSU GA230001]|uniref:glycosyltransferase n=1 Tax=Fontimonas sp. SYSU GA230001 TaxID=3142450 RepID=UPI0032B4DF20
MARLAFVWELGSYSGYSALIGQIAQAAVAQGHACVFVVKDLRACAPHLPARLGPMLQAPRAESAPGARVKIQTSYATLLHNCGYGDSDALAVRIRAWTELYRTLRIERVLARHSPTAILAARLLGLPVLHYGNGFTLPPDCAPWPSFRPDLNVASAALEHNERRVLGVVNDALARLGIRPIPSVQAIFSGVATLLLGSPELDHYARTPTPCHVDFPPLGYGAAPEWPAGDDEARLFVSLWPGPSATGWLELLERLPARSLVRFPADAAIEHRSERVRIARSAVDYVAALAHCTAVVGYGSHNLAHEALLAGKPLATMAHTPDHLLLARRVQALGTGILLPERADTQALNGIGRLLTDERLRTSAAAFAARNRRSGSAADIVTQILEHALAAHAAPL